MVSVGEARSWLQTPHSVPDTTILITARKPCQQPPTPCPTGTVSLVQHTLSPLSHRHCLPCLTDTVSLVPQTLSPLSHRYCLPCPTGTVSLVPQTLSPLSHRHCLPCPTGTVSLVPQILSPLSLQLLVRVKQYDINPLSY